MWYNCKVRNSESRAMEAWNSGISTPKKTLQWETQTICISSSLYTHCWKLSSILEVALYFTVVHFLQWSQITTDKHINLKSAERYRTVYLELQLIFWQLAPGCSDNHEFDNAWKHQLFNRACTIRAICKQQNKAKCSWLTCPILKRTDLTDKVGSSFSPNQRPASCSFRSL